MAETEVKRKPIGRPKGSKNKRFKRIGSPEANRIPERNERLIPPEGYTEASSAFATSGETAAGETRPPTTSERPNISKPILPPPSPTFYERMNRVPAADWGTRTWIYLYRLEPFLDRTVKGLPKYITKYAEAVSEEKVLQEHGSGKYKAVLNYQKPAAERGEEIDSTIFEIMNMKFPPKIPPIGLEFRTPGDDDWVQDPQNRKWKWAQNFFPSGKSAGGASGLLQDLEVLDRITNRHNNGQQHKDATEQLATVVTVAKDLAALQKAPESPAALVLEYMKLAGAASSAQLTAAQAEIAASRERGDKLMMMLIETRKEKPAETNNFNVLKEVLSSIKDFLPTIKEILPEATAAGRSRMSGWQEFTAAVLPHATEVLKPFSAMMAQMLVMQAQQRAQQQQQRPAPNGAQPAGGAAAGPQAQSLPPGTTPQPQGQAQPPAGTPPPPGGPPAFLNMIALPMLNYVRDMAPPFNADPRAIGAEFAEWVHEGYGADPRYEEALGAIKMMGAQGITAALRTTDLWTDKGPAGMRPSIAELEPQFAEFMAAFLEWMPAPETEGEADQDDDGIIKFDEAYERG